MICKPKLQDIAKFGGFRVPWNTKQAVFPIESQNLESSFQILCWWAVKKMIRMSFAWKTKMPEKNNNGLFLATKKNQKICSVLPPKTQKIQENLKLS